MGVQGYLSLYTYLLGWQQYQSLWSIMVETRLFLIPFIFIVIRCWAEPLMSMGAKNAGIISIRRLIFHVGGALAISFLAGAPIINLSPSVLFFKKHCDKSAQVAQPGHSGTTYDESLPIPNDVQVPVLWYLMLQLSNNVANTAIAGLSCEPIDYRLLQQSLALSQIHDPKLKDETRQFYNDCYKPAYSKFIHGGETVTEQHQIKNALKKYGNDDVAWIGSETFMGVPGFYNSYQASSPIMGFAFNPARDKLEAQLPPSERPKWGEPTCKQWWADAQHGLRTTLYSQYRDDTRVKLKKLWRTVTFSGLSEAQFQDGVIRLLLEKQASTLYDDPDGRGYQSESDNRTSYEGGSGIFSFATSRLGTDVMALKEFPKIRFILNALPIIQAGLLFLLFVFLAIGLPISCYSPGFCVTAAIMIFSIIFMSYIWHLVSWFDAHLIKALYLSTKEQLRNSAGLGAVTLDPAKNLTDMVVCTLYIAGPLLWLGLVNWAGIKIGSIIGFSAIEGMGNEAGKAGVKTATSAVRLIK